MEYKIGKWYTITDSSVNWVFNYQGNNKGYGFNSYREWGTNYNFPNITNRHNINLATNEEVRTTLIKEAKRRGFINNVSFKSAYNEERSGVIKESSYYYNNSVNGLFSDLSGEAIFYDGKWAEIIKQEGEVKLKDKSMKYEIGERVLVREDIGEIGDIDHELCQYYIYFDDNIEDWVDEWEISPMINQDKVESQKSESINEFEEMELAYKNAERLNNLQKPANVNGAKAINSGTNGRHRAGFTVNRPARTMDFASSKYNRRK